MFFKLLLNCFDLSSILFKLRNVRKLHYNYLFLNFISNIENRVSNRKIINTDSKTSNLDYKGQSIL